VTEPDLVGQAAGAAKPGPPRLRGPLVKGGLAAAALVYALAAAGSGLDRIIAETPPASPAAGSRPPLFADASLRRAAAIELSAGRFTEAARLAREAIIRSPVEPASTGLLGAAWLGEGKTARADTAFRVSGQLGWRDSITQTYWMQAALLGGDLPVAAQRLDAILRQHPAKAADPALLAPFETSQEGRIVLAQRLAENPGWTSAYLNPNGPVASAQLAQRAQVAGLLAKQRQLGCDGIARFVRIMIADGAVLPAHELWQMHCPGTKGQAITDPDFANGVRNDPSPFAWQRNSDGSIRVRSGGSDGGLVIENSAPFPRNFARQLLVLTAGDYRLSWRAQESDGRVSDRIEAFTGCTNETSGKILARPVAGTRLSGVLHVSGACEGQLLTFRIRPGPPGLKFGRVRVEPAAPGPTG